MSFAGCWLQTSVDGLKCLYMSREQQITPDPGRKGQLSESFVVFRAMLGGLLRRSHCLWNHLLPYKLQISRVSFPLSSFLPAPWIATSTPQLGKEYIVITFVCLHLNVARKKKKKDRNRTFSFSLSLRQVGPIKLKIVWVEVRKALKMLADNQAIVWFIWKKKTNKLIWSIIKTKGDTIAFEMMQNII